MKRENILKVLAAGMILSAVLTIGGCSSKATTVDETGYIGTYYGQHYLADSVTLRTIINDSTATMVYPDTLVITNGTSATDGKVYAKSSLLGSSTIEMDVTTGNATPANLGNIVILGTTLKNCKLNQGSTASWNTDKSNLSTHLAVSVTYNFNGTDINLPPTTINGAFVKQ